jgi:deoxyribose-phosphate aldolase
MTTAELARLLDHSVLKPEASAADVDAGVAIVREWAIGYYCVQPCWVRRACAALRGSPASVASVIAFPHGCERTEVKADAARRAVDDGAAELDMVINLGALQSGRTADVASDIAAVVRAAPGICVKVILETAVLCDAQKRLACRIACDAGAAFVKTSTGFHAAGGADVESVRLMRAEVGPDIGVKASGGIRTWGDVQAMLDAGANRIGTSASVAILTAHGRG